VKVNTGRKTTGSRVVTVVIVIFIVILAGLTGKTLLERRKPAAAAGGNSAGGSSGQRPAPAAGGSTTAGGGGGGSNAAGGNASRTTTAVRVTEVVKDTIENSIVINGDVLARTQVSIFPTVAGKIAETRFRIGDRVDRGDVVAMVDPSRPGEVYSWSPVVSTISGTILQAPVNPGDTVSVQSSIYIVGDLSTVMVETFVPERFTNAVRRGLPALVYFEGLPGETFNAVVDEVSPVLDPASRTLRIKLRFTGRDTRIKAGMFATVSLVTNTRRDVPVIPRGSVINTYGSWIIFSVDNSNIARRHVVTLGIENENLFEVLDGVELGQRVVSQGQNFLSDGDPVRIVE
jgi:multidrug efflux pump subunit AcrA (membrane-fusion protein)